MARKSRIKKALKKTPLRVNNSKDIQNFIKKPKKIISNTKDLNSSYGLDNSINNTPVDPKQLQAWLDENSNRRGCSCQSPWYTTWRYCVGGDCASPGKACWGSMSPCQLKDPKEGKGNMGYESGL